MSLFALLLSLAGAGATVALARIGFLLGWRRPTIARVCGSDLSEAERLHDRDMHAVALFDGKATWDDNHLKQVMVRVVYDAGGHEHRADITVYPHRGDRPDDTLILWYDPDDPRRVTASGIGLPLMILVGALVLAVVAFVRLA